jgi:hypothetical protein
MSGDERLRAASRSGHAEGNDTSNLELQLVIWRKTVKLDRFPVSRTTAKRDDNAGHRPIISRRNDDALGNDGCLRESDLLRRPLQQRLEAFRRV